MWKFNMFNQRSAFTASIYLLKVNNKNTKTKVWNKRRHWHRFGVFIVNFEHISHLCSSDSIVNFEHIIAGWVCYWLWLQKLLVAFLQELVFSLLLSTLFILQAAPDWNWQKIKQKLSNTQKLNFRNLKIIRFFHPRYHQKIIEDILKMFKKQVRLF